MKLAAFVALRPSLGIFVLAGAILAKVFCGFGCYVGEELHLHSTQWLACKYQRGCIDVQAGDDDSLHFGVKGKRSSGVMEGA